MSRDQKKPVQMGGVMKNFTVFTKSDGGFDLYSVDISCPKTGASIYFCAHERYWSSMIVVRGETNQDRARGLSPSQSWKARVVLDWAPVPTEVLDAVDAAFKKDVKLLMEKRLPNVVRVLIDVANKQCSGKFEENP